jgi:hypothetical protein
MEASMRRYIKIVRVPYEEPHHLELHIEASNGLVAGTVEIYVTPDHLIRIADALESFPHTLSDEFVFELGSEKPEDRWGFYFLLRVFYTQLSHCAIHMRLNNNEPLPNRQIAEFCMHITVPQLNDLGKRFRELAKLSESSLEWSPDSGAIA